LIHSAKLVKILHLSITGFSWQCLVWAEGGWGEHGRTAAGL